jgi:hypothetical protein
MVTKLEFQKEIRLFTEEKYMEKYPNTVHVNPAYLDKIADIIVNCLWNNIGNARRNEIEAFIEVSIAMMFESGTEGFIPDSLTNCWSKIKAKQFLSSDITGHSKA